MRCWNCQWKVVPLKLYFFLSLLNSWVWYGSAYNYMVSMCCIVLCFNESRVLCLHLWSNSVSEFTPQIIKQNYSLCVSQLCLKGRNRIETRQAHAPDWSWDYDILKKKKFLSEFYNWIKCQCPGIYTKTGSQWLKKYPPKSSESFLARKIERIRNLNRPLPLWFADCPCSYHYCFISHAYMRNSCMRDCRLTRKYFISHFNHVGYKYRCLCICVCQYG